jgi:aerobic C4-dicarboxylate transport protein
VSKWEGELDKERLTAELKNPSPDDTAGDLHPVREAA